jgi:surface antigen
MTKDEALKMAIKALLYGTDHTKAVNACKEALEQPAQGIELEWYVKGWDDALKDKNT